jgi:hypothetical protein
LNAATREGHAVNLKPLSKDAIPSALAKAERYRLLNEPGQAESICLDVLAVDPAHQAAIATLLLALTDQFAEHSAGALGRARELIPSLSDPYERAYYAGLICERRAIAHLHHDAHGSGQAAREWLKDALERYAEAEPLRPHGNDDAILRWNACVRLLQRLPEVISVEDASTRLMMLE